MRSVWRGAISFGLVTIAVKLYTATEEHDFRFNQIHREDGGRIRYKRVCQACDKEVAYADITKGYELEDGRMVMVEPEDFEKLPINTDHSIQVLEFVDAPEVDPIYFQKTYYLEPDKAAVRPYVLLRKALEQAEQLAIVKIAIRQRESLAVLRVYDDMIVMHTIMWPDEIRKPDFGFLDETVEVRQQELSMATSLIDSMAGTFEPEEFSDEYTEALKEMIEAKAEGAELPEKPEAEEEGEVIDLMSALERSVEAARSSRAKKSEAKPAKKAPAKTEDKKKTRSGKRTA
ncbi:DNA end-binding protein Ku [Herbihabitans rhizosphaerae]|uniref:Non-homologous end joining protein Ku n=1 Tax=Herbihabitans rhizosphaerae TaxID=1872711 RepID=A0A4Q7L5I8_9PSEU|nr:Ku protein [Herbihabitans rhizosphaerae]RZS43811.1 DNA end-binding protein Ku [Herbihabitans rhizosphaerae]